VQRGLLDAADCVLLVPPLGQELIQMGRAFVLHLTLERVVEFLFAPIVLACYVIMEGGSLGQNWRALTWRVWPLLEGPAQYFTNVWNVLDASTYGSIIAAIVLRREDPVGYPACIASGLAGLGVWLRLLSYFRGFEATGVLVNTVLQISSDIKYFLIVLLAFILGTVPRRAWACSSWENRQCGTNNLYSTESSRGQDKRHPFMQMCASRDMRHPCWVCCVDASWGGRFR
jgi:hypothetical protein